MQDDNDNFLGSEKTSSNGAEYSDGSSRAFYRTGEARRNAWNRDRAESSKSFGSSRSLANGDEYRRLLRVVNEVLNLTFPLKTLFTPVEFDCFRKEVSEALPELNDVDFLAAIIGKNADLSTQEKIDNEIDAILKKLFFHAGGTLIGCLEPHSERTEESVRDYILRHGAAIGYLIGRPQSSPDDLYLAKYFHKYLDDFNAAEGHYGPPVPQEELEQEEDEVFPWDGTVGKALDLAVWYFDGEPLTPEEFATFRRLFFLRSEPESSERSASSCEELVAEVNDAVEETYSAEDFFEVETLDDVYEYLDSKILLDEMTESTMDEITGLILAAIGARFNPSDTEEIDSDSDFDVEYCLIARHTLQTSFSNRRFSIRDDLSDFRSELLRIAGPRSDESVITVPVAREYFERVGGVFYDAPTDDASEEPALTRSELIRKVLADRFPQGLNLFDSVALEEFRNFARKEKCDKFDFETEDSKLRNVIARFSTVCRVTSADGTEENFLAFFLPEKYRPLLELKIEATVRVGAKIVYYETFFEKNESEFKENNIPNWQVLKTFIAELFPEYVFYERYYEAKPSSEPELVKIRGEIKRLWGSGTIVTPEFIAKYGFVPLERLEHAFETDSYAFERRDDGYACKEDSEPVDDELSEKFLASLDEVAEDEGIDGKGLLARTNEDFKQKTDSWLSPSSEKKSKTTEKATPATKKTDGPKKRAAASKKTGKGRSSAWRKQANVAARILSNNFKEGLDVTDSSSLELFRKTAEKNGLKTPKTDEELLKTLKRIGFVSNDRIHVVSQRTKTLVKKLVKDAFDKDRRLVYYDSFFELHQEELENGGIIDVDILKNRLKKYYPDYFFSDDYFEVAEDSKSTLSEKVRSEIFNAWDGSSSKRLNELVGMIKYIPKAVLEETMRECSDDFDSRSNGYWRRKEPAAKKRTTRKKPLKKKSK